MEASSPELKAGHMSPGNIMNKNKLIDLFVANIANSVVHKILEKAIDKEEIAERYSKEIKNSWEIAKKYREKINPVNSPLPDKDIEEIRKRIENKVKRELKLRIEKGYENINLELVKDFVEETLKEMGVI